MRRLPIVILCAATALGGCTNLNYPLSTVDGMASEQNFSAQVVDPEPAEGAPKMDAGMVDAAVDRYRNDKVKSSNQDGGSGGDSGIDMGPSGQ